MISTDPTMAHTAYVKAAAVWRSSANKLLAMYTTDATPPPVSSVRAHR